jgi:hypothetical protein
VSDPPIPPRGATERFLERTGRRLAVAFDVDLGEIVCGHRVVVRGLEHGGASYQFGGPVAHGVGTSAARSRPRRRRLTIDFEPAWTPSGWSPTSPYVRRLVVDLAAGSVAEVVRAGPPGS